MKRYDACALLALSLLAARCQSDPTQLVVLVDSDLIVGRELSEVHAVVRGDDGSSMAWDHTFSLAPLADDPGSTRHHLPISFGVLPRDGDPTKRVVIEITALGPNGAALFTRRAITRFMPHEKLLLRMLLAAQCQQLPPCGTGATCSEVGCVPVEIDERTLPRLSEIGGELQLDAGFAPREDAGESGPDTGVGPDAGGGGDALPSDVSPGLDSSDNDAGMGPDADLPDTNSNVCGNGMIEPPEQCDDVFANNLDDDGCTRDCRWIDTGTGAEGPLVAAGTTYIDDVAQALSVTATAGSTTLLVNSVSGFGVGDELLLIQMTGPNAGRWHSSHVRFTDSLAGALVIQRGLPFEVRAEAAARAQVLRVPNYTAVTVPGGTRVTVSDWDGVTGGVLAFRSRGTVYVAPGGSIAVGGRGFFGGMGGDGSAGGVGGLEGAGGPGAGFDINGDGVSCSGTGPDATQGGPGDLRPPNGGQGGAPLTLNLCSGMPGGTGGGRGANAGSASPGELGLGLALGGTLPGFGGINVGGSLTNLVFGDGGGGGNGGVGGRGGGGGGGGGGTQSRCNTTDIAGLPGMLGGVGGNGGLGGVGGRGGGVIIIHAGTIQIDGEIEARGATGVVGATGAVGDPGGQGGRGGLACLAGNDDLGGGGGGGSGANGGQGGSGGGGGAGGLVWLAAESIFFSNGAIEAIGGTGGGSGGAGPGGLGGNPGLGGATGPTAAMPGPNGTDGPIGFPGSPGGDGAVFLHYVQTVTGTSAPPASVLLIH